MSSWVSAAENGWLPEVLLRQGIRRLLRQRLAVERSGGCQAQWQRFERRLEAMERSPLALSTQAANEQHYEVPAEFFHLVLGRRLKYSSGLWSDGVTTLDEAEEAMLDLTCRRAGICDGMRILDLGCGWGSLSLWIAEKYPACRVVAVSNSAPQRRYIEAQRDARGLGVPEVVTADINSFEPGERFDRVVSVEMFEHLRNWHLLFRRIASWLTPDGKLFFHVFCHRELLYFFESQGASNWMGRNFFTGGMMPSASLPFHLQDDLVPRAHWRISGEHYGRTARAWNDRLRNRRSRVLEIFEKVYGRRQARRWWGRWRLFFLACEELFRYASGDEWLVAHTLASPRRSSTPS